MELFRTFNILLLASEFSLPLSSLM